MTTDPTAYDYAQRAVRALGQEAHDPEKVAMWCFDHPPLKPIPKAQGERTRPVYISQKVFACCLSIAKAADVPVDSIVDALLGLYLKDLAPRAWSMHVRHEQETEKLLAELRQNEPELQPQEEAPFDQIPR